MNDQKFFSVRNIFSNSVPEVMRREGDHFLAAPKSVAAVLVPYGIGAPETTPTFQCLCIDWLPSNNHSRIAGGFSNGENDEKRVVDGVENEVDYVLTGMVCVWDFGCEFQMEHTTIDDEHGLMVHPQIDISAQLGPCSSLVWCPLDSNYLCTGMEYIHIAVQPPNKGH